jgi:hypothetical protein
MKNIILISIFTSLFIAGCYYDNEEELFPNSQPTANDTSTTAKWSTDIRPIMEVRCATSGCHVSGSQSPALQTYDQVFNNRVRVQVRACIEKTMPAGNALSSSDINKLNNWINAGAPNN